jgi:E3 ubiquitin-protein ligase HERC2
VAITSGNVKEKLSLPTMPQRIKEFDQLNVSKLVVGNRHSGAITQDGKLYTFGSGNWGVLGHGNEQNLHFNQPKLVESLAGVKVKDFAAGEYHSIALDSTGSVWTWGYGGKKGMFNWMFKQEVGALGHGDVAPHFHPKKVQFFA